MLFWPLDDSGVDCEVLESETSSPEDIGSEMIGSELIQSENVESDEPDSFLQPEAAPNTVAKQSAPTAILVIMFFIWLSPLVCRLHL